jgi:hypothetical protein
MNPADFSAPLRIIAEFRHRLDAVPDSKGGTLGRMQADLRGRQREIGQAVLVSSLLSANQFEEG